MPSKVAHLPRRSRNKDQRQEEIPVSSGEDDLIISSHKNNDILGGAEEEQDGGDENASPNKSVARSRTATWGRADGIGKAAKKKLRVVPRKTYEDLEDQFNADPDKILEFAHRVPQLESNLADTKDLLKDARSQLKDARENMRIAQKQAANTQKMFNVYRKQVIEEKKLENLRIQTAESELVQMRKDIFQCSRPR